MRLRSVSLAALLAVIAPAAPVLAQTAVAPAAAALATAARRGQLGRLTVEKADGTQVLGGGQTPLRAALNDAGFVATPRGLRLRSSGA